MHTGNISQHFSWEEVEHSDTASRLGIDNTVPQWMEGTILRTANWMERVRTFLDRKAIHVNSWYRGPELQALPQFKNPTSQHPKGEAVDFICPEFGTPLEICQHLVTFSDLLFDQLIWEYTWVHISFCTADPTSNPRRQVLTLLNDKKYARGLTDKQGNPL